MITPCFSVSRTHSISSIHLCCVSFKSVSVPHSLRANSDAVIRCNHTASRCNFIRGPHTKMGSAPGELLLCAVDEQGADGAEGGQFFCVAEPAGVVNLRRGTGMGQQAMCNIRKTSVAQQLFPFIGGKQV